MDNKDELMKKIQGTGNQMKILYFMSLASLILLIVMLGHSLLNLTAHGMADTVISDMWGRITPDYENMGFVTKLMYLNLPDAVFKAIFIIRLMVTVGLSIYISYRMYRIFKNIADTGKAFDTRNLKPLKTIITIEVIISLLDAPIRGIATWFLMLCMYKSYEYGCLLQNESDETV